MLFIIQTVGLPILRWHQSSLVETQNILSTMQSYRNI